MEVDDLAAHYPQLFHMAEAGAWPSIQKHGLRSTQALLDLFEIEEPQRSEILETRRPQIIPIAHPTHGTALIRDNKPLKDSFLAKCLTDMTIPDWYAHLNGKVFFWVTETRLNELLAARDARELQYRRNALPQRPGAGQRDLPNHRRLPGRHHPNEQPPTAGGRTYSQLLGPEHRGGRHQSRAARARQAGTGALGKVGKTTPQPQGYVQLCMPIGDIRMIQ